jgi:hypothetical protein
MIIVNTDKKYFGKMLNIAFKDYRGRPINPCQQLKFRGQITLAMTHTVCDMGYVRHFNLSSQK